MADINAQDLTAETLSTLDGTENVVAFDTATGKRIPLTVLGDYIIQKLVGSATIAGSSQTIKSALDSLNSNLTGKAYSSVSALYDALIAILQGNQSAYCTVTGSAVTDMTGGATTAACRAYVMKADVTTLDYILYSASGKIVCTGQITSASTVTNINNMPTRAEMDALNNNTVNTTFASSDTSKYTLKNVRLVRRGSVYILVGEVKCVSPATSAEINIVSGNMAPVFNGQTFVPAWGVDNASKDALGVHFNVEGVYLSYGTAGSFYELVIPMFG